MKRQSLLLTSPHQLEWVEETLPPIADDELLIKTSCGAISVGTELPMYLGRHRSSQLPTYPRMTGYESLGYVVDKGSAVQQTQVGDRVVTFYGHRTKAVVPGKKIIPVPTDISDEIALLSILSCDTMKGILKANIQPTDRVLVTGAGVIGLLTVFNLTRLGINQIDVIEPLTHRRQLARQFGATKVFTPEQFDATASYQAGIECSSRNQAFAQLQQAMGPNARICILADGNVEPLVLSPAFHEKELLIVGSSDGLDYQAHASWFFNQVRLAVIPLEALYELKKTAAELAAIFNQMGVMAHPPLKVFVQYS
ncbi:MAG: alcohol dehydrogenase catalytic domain-containing protein [Chloroflexota bacterium]